MSRIVQTLIGVVLLLVPVIFFSIGAVNAWEQHTKITTWQPVTVTVHATDIVTIRGSKGSVSYRPIVSYSYRVNAAPYRSSDIFPISETGSHAYAERSIVPFAIGSTVTAYYDPDEPSHAYLVKHYAFFPYIFIIVGAIAGGVLSVVAAGMLRPTRAELADGDLAPFQLRPEDRIGQRINRRWLAVTIMGCGALGLAHYFSVANPIETAAWWVAGGYGVVMLGGLATLLHAWLVSRSFEDATVELDRRFGILGQPIAFRTSLPIRRPVSSGQLVVALVLRRSTTTGSGKSKSTKVEEIITLSAPTVDLTSVPHGSTAVTDLVTVIPADAQPTSIKSSANPKFEWRLRVHAVIAGSADYKAIFPLIVVDPAGAPQA